MAIMPEQVFVYSFCVVLNYINHRLRSSWSNVRANSLSQAASALCSGVDRVTKGQQGPSRHYLR